MTAPEYTDGQPFQPWLPTYEQVLIDWYDPTTQKYLYGFPALEIDAQQFPIISARKDEIAMRFYERYATRMLNQETMKRWQLRLQNRFDEVAPEYERAFRLYDRYKTEMEDDMLEGYKMESKGSAQNSGKDTNKNKVNNRNIDTPDKAINHDKNYADSLSETEAENEMNYGLKSDTSGETKYTRTGGYIIENLNKSIYEYRDIDTEFVKSFENNFLNILWS